LPAGQKVYGSNYVKNISGYVYSKTENDGAKIIAGKTTHLFLIYNKPVIITNE